MNEPTTSPIGSRVSIVRGKSVGKRGRIISNLSSMWQVEVDGVIDPATKKPLVEDYTLDELCILTETAGVDSATAAQMDTTAELHKLRAELSEMKVKLNAANEAARFRHEQYSETVEQLDALQKALVLVKRDLEVSQQQAAKFAEQLQQPAAPVWETTVLIHEYLDNQTEQHAKYNKELGTYLTIGWEIVNMSVSRSERGHTRFTTLKRLAPVAPAPAPEEPAAAAVPVEITPAPVLTPAIIIHEPATAMTFSEALHRYGRGELSFERLKAVGDEQAFSIAKETFLTRRAVGRTWTPPPFVTGGA